MSDPPREFTRSVFLAEYFRGTKGGVFVVAYLNRRTAYGEVDHVIARHSAPIEQFIARYDKPENKNGIYFCTGTIQKGKNSRAGEDCWQFPSLFADVDDKSHELERTRVVELLDAAECPPTIIVDSGHGLHAHWLLSEPCEDGARIEAARRRLQALTASDSIPDTARVLRLPGSHNSKHGHWLPVEVISFHPERRYHVEVLEEWLDQATTIIPRKPELPKESKQPKKERKKETSGNGNLGAAHIAGGTDPRRGQAWAQAALAACAEELASAAEGSRHNTLRDKTVRMATMIERAWISEEEVRRVFHSAAEANGQIRDYGEGHFDQTFNDAIKYGRQLPHPDLPDDTREPPTQGRQEPPSQTGKSESEQAPPPPLPFINMSNWDNEPVPEQEWTVLNRIPRGQCVLFSGEGAAGKSTEQLHLSAAHVLGRDWLGTMPEAGPAIYIDAEDDEKVLHRRLAAITNHYQVTFGDLVKGGLHLMSFVGQDAVLAAVNRTGRLEPMPLYRQLLEAAGDIKPIVMGIASCANVYAGSEIDRNQVQQFIGLLTRLAIVANGSVVLISHPSLTGITNDSGISGTTQWHNAVRARFYMKGIKAEAGEQSDSDLREIVFKKNNYGPISENIVLRYQNGLFLPVATPGSLEKLAADQTAENLFLELLDKFQAQGRKVSHTKTAPNYAPAVFAKDQKAAKIPGIRNAFVDAMDRLFEAGKIRAAPYGKTSNPHTHLVRCATSQED